MEVSGAAAAQPPRSFNDQDADEEALAEPNPPENQTLDPTAIPPGCPVRDKLLVLDDQVTIGGNYTGPANQFNDENLFMITNAQVAQHMRAEVERVFTQLAQEFP